MDTSEFYRNLRNLVTSVDTTLVLRAWGVFRRIEKQGG